MEKVHMEWNRTHAPGFEQKPSKQDWQSLCCLEPAEATDWLGSSILVGPETLHRIQAEGLGGSSCGVSKETVGPTRSFSIGRFPVRGEISEKAV